MSNIDTSVAYLENFVPESPWSDFPSVPPIPSVRPHFVAAASLAASIATSFLVAGCQTAPVAEVDPDLVGTTTLRLEIATPNDAGKQMKIAVVQSPDAWLKATGWTAARSVSVTPPLTIVEFDDLPLRPTAISVFIDVDENDDLARGLFGIPSEPYGFSNNLTVLFGPPRFSDATIELVPPSTTTSIKIRKLSSQRDVSAPGGDHGRMAMSNEARAGVAH